MKYKLRIRDLREDHDLTQKQIAEIVGTSQSYYAQYENEKRPLPIHAIRRLSVYYNISADYILGLIDRPRTLYDKPSREQIKNQQIIKNSKNFTINNQ